MIGFPPRVAAAIIGTADERRLAACREALGRQTVPVGAIHAGEGALEAAYADDATWVWLLQGAPLPRADALARLLGAVRPDGAGSDAAIVAGLVVDQHGEPIGAQVPAGRERETEDVLRLARQRLLPIRRAGFGSTLVNRDALRSHGLPHERFGAYAPQEWTARVLSDSAGYLVPASVAVAQPGPVDTVAPRDLLAALRMTRTGTWTHGEAVRALAGSVRALVRASRATAGR